MLRLRAELEITEGKIKGMKYLTGTLAKEESASLQKEAASLRMAVSRFKQPKVRVKKLRGQYKWLGAEMLKKVAAVERAQVERDRCVAAVAIVPAEMDSTANELADAEAQVELATPVIAKPAMDSRFLRMLRQLR